MKGRRLRRRRTRITSPLEWQRTAAPAPHPGIPVPPPNAVARSSGRHAQRPLGTRTSNIRSISRVSDDGLWESKKGAPAEGWAAGLADVFWVRFRSLDGILAHHAAQGLRNGCRSPNGIYTLVASGIHCPSHIVIGYAALDSVVGVCKSRNKRRINPQIIASGCHAPIHVVTNHMRAARLPGQRDFVLLA